MNDILELTEESFGTEVLESTLPVVVDFYAPWCGPCRILAPLLHQFAEEFEGRIKFAKLNVDNAPGLAQGYEVTGVPMLAAFRNGKVVDSLVGLVAPKALKSWLEGVAAGKVPSGIVASW